MPPSHPKRRGFSMRRGFLHPKEERLLYAQRLPLPKEERLPMRRGSLFPKERRLPYAQRLLFPKERGFPMRSSLPLS